MPEYLSPDGDERQEGSEIAPSALAIISQSEHAAMVTTANIKNNRRNLTDFNSKLMSYACHSEPVSLSMFYSLPRAGKQLIGPSVRFAEVVAPCWKNCAVAARVIGDASNTVTGQGIFLDYEANLRNSVEVPRRITDKNNKRFSDDMIITTSNAAMSVARRNAVLKGGVPQALWTPAYEAAMMTAVGKAPSHAQRVGDAMEYLHKLGVTEWQILNSVGVPSIRDLETEHLVTLKVLCQEIKRGDKTIEQVFGSEYDKEIDALFVQLKMNAAQQTMLRNSYLGRAEQLCAYLRERLGSPTTIDAPQRQQAKAAQPDKPATQTTEEWVAQKSGPAYNAMQKVETKVYSDGTTATGVGPLPDQSPAQQDRTVNMVEQTEPAPDNSTRDDSAFGGNAGATGTVSAKEARVVTVATPDGGTGTATVISGYNSPGPISTQPLNTSTPLGPARTPQTSMEPGKRRQGRPRLEELARRQAQEQGMLTPEPQSEQEARDQAESAMEVTDQFAF